MKFILLYCIFFLAVNCKAQTYALFDKDLVRVVSYTNVVTSMNKFNGLFPIEKKMLPQFISALKQIENKLSSNAPLSEANQYHVGGINFVGLIVLVSEIRMDYVLTSNYDNVEFSLHLCDAKISNANNLYFVKTWIDYIQSNIK